MLSITYIERKMTIFFILFLCLFVLSNAISFVFNVYVHVACMYVFWTMCIHCQGGQNRVLDTLRLEL